MARVKENEKTIVRSRLVGLRDICVAEVTTNDEDVYKAEVPVRLAKALAATVKDTFSVEYTGNMNLTGTIAGRRNTRT